MTYSKPIKPKATAETPTCEKCDAEMLRVKACEHIAEGEEGWEKLENICQSTKAVAELRHNFESATESLRKFLSRPQATAETPDLSAILERDRTKVAECVTAVKKVLEGYDWLINSRGCYEWNDDNWHKEFQKAHDAILDAIAPMVRIAADWSNLRG